MFLKINHLVYHDLDIDTAEERASQIPGEGDIFNQLKTMKEEGILCEFQSFTSSLLHILVIT